IYPMVWSRETVSAHLAQGKPVTIEPNYLKVRGVPLGILPHWKAASGRTDLNSGEILLLTSDGITEATIHNAEPANGSNQANAMLQQTGLWQLLIQEPSSLDLNDLLARIRSHNDIQEDDQTILSLEVL
ncbi:MAG: serine/threonine-protein phosphatase, partial [Leptolyngbyaceae cyanobacterium CAN_BIN12]|nr:serine/threonine-protein phosphatase [Leptolyngbyaceae cyanobacterium CAN_BIN12]